MGEDHINASKLLTKSINFMPSQTGKGNPRGFFKNKENFYKKKS